MSTDIFTDSEAMPPSEPSFQDARQAPFSGSAAYLADNLTGASVASPNQLTPASGETANVAQLMVAVEANQQIVSKDDLTDITFADQSSTLLANAPAADFASPPSLDRAAVRDVEADELSTELTNELADELTGLASSGAAGLDSNRPRYQYDDNDYLLTSGMKTWKAAQAEAEALGGNLVAINNAAEEAWLKKVFGAEQGFWIGISDRQEEGSFTWANGDAVTYTNWAPGEPSDSQGNQDYGWMNFGATQQWDDNSADALMPGIIEIKRSPATANAGFVGIGSTDLEVSESDEAIDVSVTRQRGAEGTVTVDYRTVGGSATVGKDYRRQTGTLTFAPEETQKSVSIPILDDNSLEADERFAIAIDNVTGGASLLAPRTAQVTIVDDDTPTVATKPNKPRQPDPTVAPIAQTLVGGLNLPTAIDWTPDDDTMLIAEKGGTVRVVENNKLLETAFIDISPQVNEVKGLLDVAVHPDFENNPYVYLLYAYDPPDTFAFEGKAGPDGYGNRAARLTRVTADASTNFQTAVPDSEIILLGKNSTWENFNPFVDSTVDLDEPPAGILPDGSNLQDFLAADSESHTIGSVEFGLDGALYVSNGDGTSYNQLDKRTLRVQDIDNLSGKILRVDPLTGEGLSDNPFYNGNADANRSKVYQLGLRNPFRFAIDPVTGQPVIGDVGWTTWEEINTGGAGANFGWPYYEGANGVSKRTTEYKALPEAKAFYRSKAEVTPALLGLNHTDDGIDAIVMGDIYDGDAYPDKYTGDIFYNHLGRGLVRNVSVDADGNVTDVEDFATDTSFVVDMAVGPDGTLHYVDLDDGEVGRWTFE